MFLFLSVVFGTWRVVEFDTWGGKGNKMCLLKKKPTTEKNHQTTKNKTKQLLWGWDRGERTGEKVTHLSITLYSIFSYQFVTVLSSHLRLLSLECCNQ